LNAGVTTFKLTPHEYVTVRERSFDALEVEGEWGPGGKPPPKHFHPAQDERFEVLDGTLWARVDGAEHRLSPGDVLEVPRGAVHQMWNAAEVPARAIWRTSPAGRTYDWFAALDGLLRSERVGRNGMPSPLAFGAYLTEYSDVIRLAGPQPLVGGAVRVLGEIGRRRGYSPRRSGPG
jgi:quercetin dioxygenase-like cupin family protein